MWAHDSETIVREHYSDLYRRARRLCGNHDLACDLVQSVFERCLRMSPGTLPPQKAQAWLRIVLRNLFLDGVRAAGRHWVELGTLPDCFQPRVDEPCEPPTWESFHAEDLRTALKRLPEKLRRAYEMHALADVSYHEIACQLGISERTVGTRIHRAKHRLRSLMLEHDEPPSHDHALSGLDAIPAPSVPLDVGTSDARPRVTPG